MAGAECLCHIFKWDREMKKFGNHCYRRTDVTDEAVINELNCIEQIYKRFQAPFGLN